MFPSDCYGVQAVAKTLLGCSSCCLDCSTLSLLRCSSWLLERHWCSSCSKGIVVHLRRSARVYDAQVYHLSIYHFQLSEQTEKNMKEMIRVWIWCTLYWTVRCFSCPAKDLIYCS